MPGAPEVSRTDPSMLQTETHGGDVATNEVASCRRSPSGSDRAAWTVRYIATRRFGVFALKEQQLGTHLIGDFIIDIGTEHDDAAREKTGKNIATGIGPPSKSREQECEGPMRCVMA